MRSWVKKVEERPLHWRELEDERVLLSLRRAQLSDFNEGGLQSAVASAIRLARERASDPSGSRAARVILDVAGRAAETHGKKAEKISREVQTARAELKLQ
jgi:hypothetical protein